MPPLRSLTIVLLAGLALALAADRVAAQQQRPPVHVLGRVIDDATLTPVSGVSVLMVDPFGEPIARRTTDELGEFAFEVRNRTAVRFVASRLGFTEVTTPILRFGDRDFFSVEVRMDAEAVLLAPLEVVARSEPMRSPVFSGFDHRLQSGFGVFFTREDMENIQPQLVTDVLARVPGVVLESSGRGGRRTVRMSRSQAMPGCITQVYVDGRLMRAMPGDGGGVPIDDLVPPEAVEGIEVYRGLASTPPEFLSPAARCGVVAIWTRRR